MIKPVNLFRVSRIRDERLFNIMEKHEASDHDNHMIRIHEIDSLRILTDALSEQGVPVKDLDGFYFGFVIPLIGKEFDLLKVTGKYCLNIELKSRDVGEEHILAQLRKNRHYLKLLGRELMLYTVVTDTLSCYRLSDDDELERTDIGAVAWAVKRCGAAYHGRIDKLFRASEYLIFPEEDPVKFLQGQYFLTPAQDQVKTQLLKDMKDAPACSFFRISGKPGTGKTLLIYDLARQLSETGRTLIVCGEEPSEGLKTISAEIKDLDFICAADKALREKLRGYGFVLVDEALSLDPAAFESICDMAKGHGQTCIFCTDPAAVLTEAEKKNEIEERIGGLGLAGDYPLSERMRVNLQIQTFMRKLMYLESKTEKSYEYEHISVNCANDADEARGMIMYYRDKGYMFINAHRYPGGPYEDLEESLGCRHVAGRGYDDVVMLMDDSFSYDSEGYLRGIPVPDPAKPYPNIFYPEVTLVREHLALVIVDAPQLLESVISIIE